jgi:DNA-binding CsgD family transcriptional regulator
VIHSLPHKPSTSTNRAASGRTSAHAYAADLLLLEDLHAGLPVGMLVNDVGTLEVLHGNAPLPGLADRDLPLNQPIESHNDEHQPHHLDDHQPHHLADELASVVEEVAATGRPRHLPEFRHDSPGQGPSWWSATLHRIDTDRWGLVVVTLTVDLTDQVLARHFLEERERRHLSLQQTIAAVPGPNLVSALQQVADSLVPALPADVAALRLLDTDANLHLVATNGLRPAETRRLALDPIPIRRLETMIEASRHLLLGSLGLHWIEVRWIEARDKRIGILTIGGRSKRRPPEDDLRLLDAVSAQLGNALEKIEQSPQFLRSRSLEVARSNADASEIGQTPSANLRPRELAILRLYREGLRTDQIAELLVLSPHTIRTHVRNARRHLGVSSRAEALDLLKAADADPLI